VLKPRARPAPFKCLGPREAAHATLHRPRTDLKIERLKPFTSSRQTEAHVGRERNALIPVLLRGVSSPFGFGLIQATYLKWRRAGDPPADEVVARARLYLWMEVALFPLLLVCAAAMARGYGEF
jgi:hypothetical protein